MYPGSWSGSLNPSPARSALPGSRPSKTPPDTRKVTKSGWKKSRAKVSWFQSPSMRVVVKTLFLGTVVIGWLFTAAAWAQIVGESAELERVLAQMDAAARNFKTTEASVVWEQYQKVIDE